MAVIDGFNINGTNYDLRDADAVRFNEAQSLTNVQKQQGRQNIDAMSVNQGIENAGKALIVGDDGNVTLVEFGDETLVADHALMVGKQDGIVTLKDSDFTRGYSLNASTNANYPFLVASNARMCYVPCDIVVEHGKTYEIEVTVPQEYMNTAQVAVQAYDQTFLDAYYSQAQGFNTRDHLLDSGWNPLRFRMEMIGTQSGENIVCARFVFRQDTLNTPISDDFKIIQLTFREVAADSQTSEEVVLHNSDFSANTRIVFGTDVAWPYTSSESGYTSYVNFNVPLEAGATYRISASVSQQFAGTAQMILAAYDESLVNAYQNRSNINFSAHVNGNGWGNLTQDYVVKRNSSGEMSVGLWMSFKKNSSASGNLGINEVTITKLSQTVKIRDVDEAYYVDRIYKGNMAYKIGDNGFAKYLPNRWPTNTLYNAVTISEPEEELMTHTSNIFDGGDGYFYITYYANHTSGYEGFTGDIISKIAKVPQWNLHDSTVVETLRKGQDFGTFVQSTDNAPYDQILIPKPNGMYSYVFIATPVNGVPTVATIDFDKENMALDGNANLSNFKYTLNGTTHTVVMSTTNLDTFINALLGTTGKTIGTYMILTKPAYYNGAYYVYMGGFQNQSGQTGFGGVIIKTTDYGHTWEYVAYNSDFTPFVMSMWEGALDISHDGVAYCMLRAVVNGSRFGTGNKQMAIAVTYDIPNAEWGDYKCLTGMINDEPADPVAGVYYNEDSGTYTIVDVDNSRPFVFIKDGSVYMMQNIMPEMKTIWRPEGVLRSSVQVWKFDEEMNLRDFTRFRSDAGCHYFSLVNAGGRVYMSFSEDIRHQNDNARADIAVIPVDFLP